MELNTMAFDDIDNIVYWEPDEFFDRDRYTECKAVIFNQLEGLNNLGQDMFKDLDLEDVIKDKVLYDVIDYIKENYLNLADKDFMLTRTQLVTNGMLLYEFLCVDCFNIILPKFIDELKIQNIVQFDKLISRREDNTNFIKTQFITNISEIVNNLLKLKKIDHTIEDDESYKNLVNRFGYYLELIDFSDSNNFIVNYIRPVLNKYFDQLLWRTL
jgi:hypothetical protein